MNEIKEKILEEVYKLKGDSLYTDPYLQESIDILMDIDNEDIIQTLTVMAFEKVVLGLIFPREKGDLKQ